MHGETIRLPATTTQAELLARRRPAQRRPDGPRHPRADAAAEADRSATRSSAPHRPDEGRRRLPPGERRQAADRRAATASRRARRPACMELLSAERRATRGRGRRRHRAQQHRRQADGGAAGAEPGVDATVTVCHSRTRDLASHTRRADILIAAIGRAQIVTARHGEARRGGDRRRHEPHRRPDDEERHALVGDVDFDAVRAWRRRSRRCPAASGR